jgi:hypothetical protein
MTRWGSAKGEKPQRRQDTVKLEIKVGVVELEVEVLGLE